MPTTFARLLNRTRAAFLALCGLVLSACATRQQQTTAPVVPVAAGIVWRIEEGDIIKTKVYGSTDLNADVTVSPNGTGFFPAIGRLAVTGLTLDSLEVLLNSRYSTQVVRNSAVQVTMTRDLTVYGQLRSPGIYAVDPGITILSLLARGGGQMNVNSAPKLYLEMTDGRRFELPREARLGSIDLHRRDGIYVAEESFFLRNQSNIAAAGFILNMLTAALGLIALGTR